MQIRRNLIYTLVILIGLNSCAKKNYVYCGFSKANSTIEYGESIVLRSNNIKMINIDSEIYEFKRLGITDTSSFNFSGKIYEKSIHQNDTLILPFANIRARDIKTDSIIETTSNLKGLYKLTLPKSEYDITFQFVGFNSLKIYNFKIGSNEILSLSVILGQGNGKTVYTQNSLNSFIKNK